MEFINYSKDVDKNLKNIKKIIQNSDLKFDKKYYTLAFENILNNFKNTNENIVYKISIIKNFLKYIDSNLILKLMEEINIKSNVYIDDKHIFSLLKSLLIECKKQIYSKNNKKTNEIIHKNIENKTENKLINKQETQQINQQDTQQINQQGNEQKNQKENISKKTFKKCITTDDKIDKTFEEIKNCNDIKKNMLLVSKLSIYIDRKYNEISISNSNINSNLDVTTSENSNLYNNLIKKFNEINYKKELLEPMLKLINKCKKFGNITNNELEKILLECDKNIYEYIFFINELYEDKDKTIQYLSKLSFEKKAFTEIDSLNLKRGFITGLTRDNKDYLLKYQPNKSVMELIINCYLKSLNCNYFLIPTLFFINNDNSYFYIIEKYNTDLYKYFTLLDEKKKILTFKNIIFIIKFIINSIDFLHSNNIIHSDYKLENIILNYDENYDITDMKIIDFDVGVFNSIPDNLKKTSENYQKILNNKKLRGTRIYMLKEKMMSFHNDIYSLGVIAIVLMYKNTKLLLTYNKNIDSKNIIKNLIKYRNDIEENKAKLDLLKTVETYLKKEFNKKNKTEYIFYENKEELESFKQFKAFINDCLDCKRYDIKMLKTKYNSLFNFS